VLLEVGRIVKPHGLRGEVIVDLTSNRPEQRLAARAVLQSDRGPLEVVSASAHQHRWIVAFSGVRDRDGAEELRNLVLRAEPIEGEEDTLWVHELVGSLVYDTLGRCYGPVEVVEANPASDLLVLTGTHLVPLTFVVETSPGRVVVEPPAGLFDGWEEVVLVPYDPEWPARFEAEAARVREALGDVAVRIEHYGSTSVPGMTAKPIVDIQLSVLRLEPMDPYRRPLEDLGYAFVELPDNERMPFFGWPAERPRLFNMHVVEAGSTEERRHLALRDRLRDDPELAALYVELKEELAVRFAGDVEGYAAAKTAFVEEALA
jgi:16S rRNA processing protein RimM